MKESFVGAKFGKLTIVEIIKTVEKNGKNLTRAKCICECGNTSTPSLTNLKRGETNSCGCMRRRSFYARSSYYQREMKMILERQRSNRND
jgi:hypothetical protein